MEVLPFIHAKMSAMPNIGKCQLKFMCEVLIISLRLRGRVNFLNLARYGNYSEQYYRQNFRKDFDFKQFNRSLIEELTGSDRIWIFDPTYIAKSGKHTPGVGYFWSGCANAVKWGLELGGLAIGDLENNTALHYHATQTGSEKKDEDSLLEYYAKMLANQASSMQELSKIVCVDAFFSKTTFVEPLVLADFMVVSRLAHNAFLRYLYTGEKRKGGGRPKQFDGKIDPHNVSTEHFTLDKSTETTRIYSGRAHVRALKRWVKLVIEQILNEDGTVKKALLYFSTDLEMDSATIQENYHMRYKIEFIYRDTKGHLGLEHCQSRDQDALNFHHNMALTTLNIAKAVHWYSIPKEQRPPFSIADIKTKYINQHILDSIISIYGKDPKVEINNPEIRKLYELGSIAA